MYSQQLDNDIYIFLEGERSKGRVMRNIDIKEIILELAGTISLFNNSYPQACVSLHGSKAGM